MKKSTLTFLAIAFLSLVGCRDVEIATVNRAYRWHKRGDYDRAIQQFSVVLSSNPTNLYALAGRGDSYAEKKEYEKALGDYDKAIEHHPSHAKLYYHRGVCWQEFAELRGWYDEDKLVKALADYDKAIELDVKYIPPYVNRAFINKMMGNYKLALSDYETILTLDPGDAKAKEAKEKTLKAIAENKEPQIRDEPPPE